jgi:hypothetical protein
MQRMHIAMHHGVLTQPLQHIAMHHGMTVRQGDGNSDRQAVLQFQGLVSIKTKDFDP